MNKLRWILLGIIGLLTFVTLIAGDDEFLPFLVLFLCLIGWEWCSRKETEHKLSVTAIQIQEIIESSLDVLLTCIWTFIIGFWIWIIFFGGAGILILWFLIPSWLK